MWEALSAEPQAVVFVSDRTGAAVRRRERCLKLAGIPYSLDAERRPSGTYYKLSVRQGDAVAAHLALQMGGCGRSLRLREDHSTVGTALKDIARTLWDELVLLVGQLFDFVRDIAPRLLTAPRETASR